MSRLRLLSDHLMAGGSLQSKTTRHPLSPPSLEDLARTILPALQANYRDAFVTVTNCPDLRDQPFHLASQGLCGYECVADIGGQPYLFPRPLLDKKYSMLECAECMQLPSDKGMLIGAGAGPFHVLGKNSELAPNLSWEGGSFHNVTNETHFAMIESHDSKAQVLCNLSPSVDCALMANLYGSAGEPGQVLKITARSRIGDQKSFTECIRRALHQSYGNERQVAIGGVFVIKRGKAKYHVMPDFPLASDLPWQDRKQLDKWLTYHDFGSPMVCLSVFHSADPEKLGLRMEHTHCFSADKQNEAGHYHYDLLPDEAVGEEIEYEAYFNTAKVLYRIDRPVVTSK